MVVIALPTTKTECVSLRTPIGAVEITLSLAGILRLRFVKRLRSKRGVLPGSKDALRDLRAYFLGRKDHFDLKLKMSGTAFEHRVWRSLQKIPCGETRSYGELARRVGRPRAYRAVARACARNPLPIIVPCHRIIGSGGRLSGYSSGVWRKRWLLKHESRLSNHNKKL